MMHTNDAETGLGVHALCEHRDVFKASTNECTLGLVRSRHDLLTKGPIGPHAAERAYWVVARKLDTLQAASTDTPAHHIMTTAPSLNLAIIGSRGFPSTYGGYETLVRHLARDWTAQGHSVTAYCRTRHGRRRVWTNEGVRCIWTPGWDTNNLSTLSFGATSHVDAVCRRYDAALVLNVANGFFLPLLRLSGIPTAVNTDGVEWQRGKWGFTARHLFRIGAVMTARFADVLIADSQAIAVIWRTLFAVESTFVPYGAPVVDIPHAELVNALGLVPRRYVLVVARLIPENNVEIVLDAVDALPERPELVVVGAASSSSSLVSRLREANRRGALRWLGHVDDQNLLTQLWSNAGVYVHGHSVGGTNPGLLQALGAGAPTLALDTVFNREVVRSDDQLFPHDAAKLAMRIRTVLADERLQSELSAHGKRVIRQHYDWGDVSSRYLAALLEARDRRQYAGRR
jgi:glycosyltransferase involved in cell wall biosynthesis